jgi:hypothetical protein
MVITDLKCSVIGDNPNRSPGHRFSDISVGLEPPVPWSGLVAFIRQSYTLWPSRVMTAAM